MGDFQCPVDFENYVGYDCIQCDKYRFHVVLLRRFGKRATCRVARMLRDQEAQKSKEVG